MLSSTIAEPVIGDFATHTVGTDSYAVEIVGIERKGRTVITREAGIISSGAMPGDDEFMGVERGTYSVFPNEAGAIIYFTRRGDGSYRPRGANTAYLKLGVVSVYRDPNF